MVDDERMYDAPCLSSGYVGVQPSHLPGSHRGDVAAGHRDTDEVRVPVVKRISAINSIRSVVIVVATTNRRDRRLSVTTKERIPGCYRSVMVSAPCE